MSLKGGVKSYFIIFLQGRYLSAETEINDETWDLRFGFKTTLCPWNVLRL